MQYITVGSNKMRRLMVSTCVSNNDHFFSNLCLKATDANYNDGSKCGKHHIKKKKIE